VRIEKSKIDDSTNVYATLRAKESVYVRYGQRRPVLWLRCLENSTALILDMDGGFVADIQGYGTVTLRIDEAKAFDRHFRESTDNSSLGLWSGGEAIPLIKRLFGASTLIARVTPFNESSVLIEFDVRGVEHAVEPIRKACGW
jgi:type VI secretion system protein VasI